MIGSVLIANRGEIACRIIRTARRLGIETIAVHSDADADAPHVTLADRAVAIGGNVPAESYLDIAKILEAARDAGACSVHPGYGFLSENAAFARAVIGAGLLWIGPPPAAIELMGDKARAKRRMIEAGVPCLPGYQEDAPDDGALVAAARETGFPTMVKAAAGGGGKGMRLVEREQDLEDAIASARAEASRAFGSDELILERALLGARHVEIQIFADAHGTVVHLGERDCSLQRRHQKVIEEAPGPSVDADLRERMGAAAVDAARAVDYRGAGTVEFLLDGEDFYFLEMNTRLQVEHPVTEMVTGLDLVALQFRVAAGEPLGLAQSDIRIAGHAIEARLYAEDPEHSFLPQTGEVALFEPAQGPGIRTDAGIATGQQIAPFYDPMIAKVIAHGASRDVARRRLIDALKRTVFFGPATNRGFLIDLLQHPAFVAGRATTRLIDDEVRAPDGRERGGRDVAMAAVLLSHAQRERALRRGLGVERELLGWSSGAPITHEVDLDVSGATVIVAMSARPGGRHEVQVGSDVHDIRISQIVDHSAVLELDGAAGEVHFVIEDERIRMTVDGRDFTVVRAVPGRAEGSGGTGTVRAPMHGLLAEMLVATGQEVAKGDRVAVLEAMKMRHPIEAPVDGTVAAVHCSRGDQIAGGATIIEIEEN